MREKYESLALVDLKAIAKARRIKGSSTMRKAELVEAMLAQDEIDKAAGRPVEVKSLAGAAAPAPITQSAERTNHSCIGTAEGMEYDAAAVGRSGAEERVKPAEAAGRMQSSETAKRAENAGNGGREKTEYRAPVSGKTRTVRPAGQRIENGTQPTVQPVSREESPEAAYKSDPSAGTDRKQENSGAGFIDVENCLTGLDSGVSAHGILEVMTDGFGFIRCENYLPGEHDVYVAPSQIRRFGLKTGDILEGNTRVRSQQEKFSALLYVKSVNGYAPDAAAKRGSFEKMTPIFPNERIQLEMPGSSVAMRIMDLISPIGKGQRGMIVSPPKAGKTTLLKEVARSVKRNYPDMHLIILLIDERPEEVTDMKEAIEGPNVEVIYSTFDELPDRHKRVSEMVIERARRLVEHQRDVMILIDSITRLARAYNQVIPPSGRTLSGGLDPAALHMPKRFFGAARNMREGGSLTILATALVDTGSKMDDVVYEEFKGTGNMELVLDRKLSERRVFPAIDIPKSGTRREDLLLTREERDAINIIRRALTGMKQDEATDKILDMFAHTRNNAEFVATVKKMKFFS